MPSEREVAVILEPPQIPHFHTYCLWPPMDQDAKERMRKICEQIEREADAK